MYWLDKIAWQSWSEEVKRTLISKFGLFLLAMGKPFTKIGNWFWKRHRDVLDWGNK